MVVNVEFLDKEPIENVITCMHYKVDKVIFFGNAEIDTKPLEEKTTNFLSRYCGVSKRNISFVNCSMKDATKVYKLMEKTLKPYLENDEVYFDITGGDSLILVMFGMLAKEYNIPIHMFNVETDKLIEIEKSERGSITGVPQHERSDGTFGKIEMTVEKYLYMNGCSLNRELSEKDEEIFENQVIAVYDYIKNHKADWTNIMGVVSRIFKTNTNNCKGRLTDKVARPYHDDIIELFKLLEEKGAITDYSYDAEKEEIKYSYTSELIKDAMVKAGNFHELYVHFKYKRMGFKCEQGVCVDWDINGMNDNNLGDDVYNEIDEIVLSENGNYLTFVSCKSGNIDKDLRNILYELDAVAAQCGGKYAKRCLVSLQKITNEVGLNRAKLLKIQIED